MEVHHPHHHGKKNIKEYIVEFLMLFLAISLGFLAENYREHFIESHKELQYMESLITDLKNDTSNLSKSIPTQKKRVASIDSIFRFFKAHPSDDKIPVSVVKHMHRVSWEIISYRNTTTISQLKNSGGLRLIRNKKVADSIAVYDMRWTRIDQYNERYFRGQQEIYTLEQKILNAFDALDAFISNDGTDNQNNIPKTGTISINKDYVGEYLNVLAKQQTVTRQDVRSYEGTIKSTERLIELIKKEYKISE